MRNRQTISELQLRGDILLVLYNDHTLGYVDICKPHELGVLHASIIKGARWSNLDAPLPLYPGEPNIRLATKHDFMDFNVSFDGYETDSVYKYVFSEADHPIHVAIPHYPNKDKRE